MFRSFMFASLAVSLFVPSSTHAAGPAIAPSADATKPLEKGTDMPDAVVHDSEGNETSLKKLTAGKPTVLVFFRGGWCPICRRHTGQLIKAYPRIQAQGAQLVAISPDSPKSTEENQTKNSIPFPVYSDSDLTAAKAYSLNSLTIPMRNLPDAFNAPVNRLTTFQCGLSGRYASPAVHSVRNPDQHNHCYADVHFSRLDDF